MICRKCGINETTKGQRWCSKCKSGYKSPNATKKLLAKKWLDMFRRCYDPKHYRYNTHGAIGITVCNEWDDFDTFYKWCLDNKWKKGLHLDRIDNKGNYEPSNCHLITAEEHFAKTAKEREMKYSPTNKWVLVKHSTAPAN